MRQLTFGSDEAAAAALRRILGIHDRVNGTLHEAVGPHAGGARYSAHDPSLLLWVHATLLDSHVRILEPVLRPFTPTERDRCCRGAAVVAVSLGATPDAVPCTWEQLQDFITAQIESGQVNRGGEAQALAAAILQPALGHFVALATCQRACHHRLATARD